MNEMNSKSIQRCLIRNMYTPDKIIIPNAHFAGGEMDLLIVSRAGYLTELEIKISLADWKADAKKDKWRNVSRKYVTYFNYCIPLELWQKNKDRLDQVLPHVKPEYGIITFEPVSQSNGKTWLSMCTQRQAKTLDGTEKLPKRELDYLIRKGYIRYINTVLDDARQHAMEE